MNKKNIINAVKEDNLLDYVSSNRHLLSKDELVTIFKEIYIESYFQATPSQRKMATKNIIKELEERL